MSSTRSADAAVGMMDSAYFVGRQQLLTFFNDLLDLQLSKIEQTASGAVACQLTDIVFPGSIPMARVNWEAKSDYEFINNYKLLQAAFSKNHVQRHVDVDKLIRAKYQDNLEFCQWLKAFYDQSGAMPSDEYDAKAVRAKGKGGKKYNDSMSKGDKSNKSTARARPGVSPKVSTTTQKPRVPARPVRPTTTTRTNSPTKMAPLKNNTENNKSVASKATHLASSAQADAQLLKKNSELENRVRELETSVADIEKERDFYFGKLRNVELMLQVKQDKCFEDCELESVVDSIFKVLYATADEDVTVDEDGEIIPSAETAAADTSVISAELSEALASEITAGGLEDDVGQ
ncbi:calponin homology domain containing protein [Nitzschia inconspicua]|uniref:Calponin homology domain containing protein n=1 Tax=Nitzschia inconspicua TaxID=303405 RepID=A0A9K3PR80_9STRA|nr:calponin homology domain containing protein [Nitzschia inconspicua]